ncbi:MAG: polysaccharide deacetylase family protein [Polyangiaceae bacterium]
MRAAFVSVDLDEVHLYRGLHGLAQRTEGGELVSTVAVERACAFAAELEIPLTFFVVSAELERPAAVRALERALALGHAVESHTRTHPYDLVELGAARIADEVLGSFDDIERRLAVRPRGFRAPGYIVNAAVFDALEQAGARFDASVLPCPAYYFAKLAVMGALFQVGRRSSAIVGPLRSTVAPRSPYRPGADPYRIVRAGERARSLVELPMQVTRGARLPIIGQTLALAGERGARWLARGGADGAVFSLELHGMDFLEAGDGLADLVGHQPELRIGRTERMRALAAAVRELSEKGYRFVTAARAAELATSLCI